MKIGSNKLTSYVRVSPYVFPLLIKGHEFKHKRELSLSVAMECVCDYFGITEAEIKSATNKREITYPRHCLIYILCFYTSMGVKEISDLFPPRKIKNRKKSPATNMNHSTVIHAREKIKVLMKYYKDKRDDIEKIVENCELQLFGTVKDLANAL